MSKTTNDYTYFPHAKFWQVAFGRTALIVTVLIAISKILQGIIGPHFQTFTATKPRIQGSSLIRTMQVDTV